MCFGFGAIVGMSCCLCFQFWTDNEFIGGIGPDSLQSYLVGLCRRCMSVPVFVLYVVGDVAVGGP